MRRRRLLFTGIVLVLVVLWWSRGGPRPGRTARPAAGAAAPAPRAAQPESPPIRPARRAPDRAEPAVGHVELEARTETGAGLLRPAVRWQRIGERVWRGEAFPRGAATARVPLAPGRYRVILHERSGPRPDDAGRWAPSPWLPASTTVEITAGETTAESIVLRLGGRVRVLARNGAPPDFRVEQAGAPLATVLELTEAGVWMTTLAPGDYIVVAERAGSEVARFPCRITAGRTAEIDARPH